MATTGYAAAIDSNDLIMSYVPETTWATTPATVPTFQKIRLDSEGFSASKSRTRPSEIDPSGQASAAITTKQESTGSLAFSVAPSITFNPLLAASLSSDWSGETMFSSTVATTFTTASSSTTNRTVQLTVTGAVFTSGTGANALHAGQYVTVGIYVSATQTRVFTGKVTTITGPTVLQLGDCYGDYSDQASAVTGTSYIKSYGSFISGDGTTNMIATLSLVTGNACTLTMSGTQSAAGCKFNTAASSSRLFVGQMIKIGVGVATTADASSVKCMTARVKSITDNLVVLLDCCSVTPVAASLGAAFTIRGSYVRNGISFQSFTFEKQLSTAASSAGYQALRYTGCFPNDGGFDVGVGDYMKCSMNFINSTQTKATSALSGAIYNDPVNTVVIDSIKGIGTVWRGSDTGTTAGVPAAVSATVQKIGVKWTKEGAAAQYGIGSAAALGVRPGKITVSGSFSTYFKDFTLYDQFITEVSGPILYSACDGRLVGTTANAITSSEFNTTRGYYITVCNATIMNPKVVAGGPGQDLMADFELEGNPDVTSMYGGRTVQIDFFV